MTRVCLHGALGEEFGGEWDLNVDSVAELVAALDANTGSFINYLQKKQQEHIGYEVVIDGESIDESELAIKKPKREIHITPVLEGGGKGAFKIILGVALIALPALAFLGAGIGASIAGAYAATWGSIATSLGIGLLMQGITEMMTKQPSLEEGKQTQSFLFENQVNNELQGQAIPVGYGRLRVGSQVIGVSLNNKMLIYKTSAQLIREKQEKRKAAWKGIVDDWLKDVEIEMGVDISSATINNQFYTLSIRKSESAHTKYGISLEYLDAAVGYVPTVYAGPNQPHRDAYFERPFNINSIYDSIPEEFEVE
jgi:predicted phage tail protein